MECTLYLSEGCNMHCRYCYEGKQKKNGLMDKGTVEHVLEYLVENALENEKIHLILLGGEPLLNKTAFFHIINIIRNQYGNIRKKFLIEMTTNGTLLDGDVIKAVKDEKIELSVSIDGKKETQDMNRMSIDEKDEFPIIMKNIHKMLALIIPFNIRMTVSNNNVMRLYENVVFFFKMGIQRVHISYDYFADWTENELLILDGQMQRLDEFYLDKIADTDTCVLNLYDFKYTTFLAKRPTEFCSAGSIGHFVVNCGGDIFPCGYVANEESWKIGSINDGINESVFRKCVKRYVMQNFSCKSCKIAFTCLATRCGFLNYRTTGLLNQPKDTVCRLEHILYEHNLRVFQELYRRKAPRIMKYIEIAKEYGLEPNDCVKNMVAV